jgi:cytochrome c-type biogenesis protein CcmH
LCVFLALTLPFFALGQEPQPAEQQRMARLAEQLRCLVCQNQSIADSNADLAVDLRRQIAEQIAQGRSDREIVDFMVQRYGDFVLYNPPVKATTLLLWLGPPLLVLLGAGVLLRSLRERRKLAEPPALNDEERRTAAQLLDTGYEGDRR